MISQMAKEDICALEKQGVNPTYEEIIRLNALGVKAENSADSYTFFAIPRCVFLRMEEGKDIVLREPTLGHEIWYDSVSRQFDVEDDVTLLALRLYMASRDVDELPKWYHISQVKADVEKFLKNDVKDFTIRQLMDALKYCVDGNDPEKVESDDETTEGEDCEKREKGSTEIGVMREAQAIGLGLTMEEMRRMTASELQNTVLLKYEQMKIDVGKKIKEQAIGEYYRQLEAIKQAHGKTAEEENEVIENG